MTIEEAKKRLLDIARAEIGYRESGDNQIKYASGNIDNLLYGFDMNGSPWCDFFVDWCFIQAFGYDLGSAMTYQFSGCCGAACSSSASYYRQNNALYDRPESGDQVFFYVSGGINHTGIVEEVVDGYIATIEGNSSDMVKRNRYPIGHSSIAGYGRPAWKYALNATETLPDGGNAAGGIITPAQTKISQIELKNGSIGWLVTALQAILNHYGADLDADGEFGRLTEAALIKYQKTHKAADGSALDADGICGQLTWGSF